MGLMQLYWVGDRYVRTQSEAAKLGFGLVTEVPTDKDGLMAYLNKLHSDHALSKAFEQLDQAEPSPAPDGVLRKCDVEDAIQAATAHDLVSYAENVADRLRYLTRELESKS